MSDLSPCAANLGPPEAKACPTAPQRPGPSLSCQVFLGRHPLEDCWVLSLSADRVLLSIPELAVLCAPHLFRPGRSLLVVLDNVATLHRRAAHLKVVHTEGPDTGPFRVEVRFAYPLSPNELRLLLWENWEPARHG